jgi:hypothetical protein
LECGAFRVIRVKLQAPARLNSQSLHQSLSVHIADGDPPGRVGGAFRPHALRDLWFGRMLGANGSPTGGACPQIPSHDGTRDASRLAPRMKQSRSRNAGSIQNSR